MIEPPPDSTTSSSAIPQVTDILIVGQPNDLRTQAIAAAFQGRADFSVGRVDEIPESMAVIGGAAELVLFVFLDSRDEAARLMKIHTLTEQGARVIVIVASEKRELRAMAFAAGAADVVYPPFEPQRIEAVVAAMLHRWVRRGVRCPTDVPVTVAPPVGTDVHGILRNVSRDGFLAELPVLPAKPGEIVRLGIRPGAKEALPFLFARVIAIDPAPGGANGGGIRAQFVGLTQAEREALDSFVTGMVAIAGGELPDQIDVLANLDAMRLREQLDVDIAGVRAPALSGYERAGLFSDDGGAPARFAVVALARARATMLGTVAGRANDPGEVARLLQPHRERLLAELQQARDVLRDELATRMSTKAEAAVREIRNLQAKLEAAADVLSRAFGGVERAKAAGLQEVVSQPTTFDKAAAAAASAPASAPASGVTTQPSRTGRARLVALACVLIFLAIGAVAATFLAPKPKDAALVVDSAPRIIVGPLHVTTWFRDPQGRTIAVVDGTWYTTGLHDRAAGVHELARQIGLTPAAPLLVRDYRGRTVAVTTSGGGLILH